VRQALSGGKGVNNTEKFQMIFDELERRNKSREHLSSVEIQSGNLFS